MRIEKDMNGDIISMGVSGDSDAGKYVNPKEILMSCIKGRKPMINKKREKLEICLWIENEDGYWTTSCEQDYAITEGNPKENNMKFCHFCGKKIKMRLFK